MIILRQDMNCDLLISNGNIVTPEKIFPGFIAITGGRISAIDRGDAPFDTARVIDAQGRHILPGVIDPHAHLGYMDTLEAVETETRAAACGGVTTLGVYILALKEGLLRQFGHFKDTFEGKSFIDGFWHLMVIDALTTSEIESCPAEVGLTSFKFNMGLQGPPRGPDRHHRDRRRRRVQGISHDQ